MEALKKEHALAFPTKSLEDDEYPRIVSYGHYDRLKQMLDKTGGNVAIKGEEKKEIKMMGVSVVTDVTWDDELMKRYVMLITVPSYWRPLADRVRNFCSEIFGPILPIVPVTSISSAIEHLKDDSPLAMYIFSQSDKFISGVRDATTSGAVLVNDVVVHFNVDGLPFGGVGESGQGSYHGKRSFDVFTHERSSLANPFWCVLLLCYAGPVSLADILCGVAGPTPSSQSGTTPTRISTARSSVLSWSSGSALRARAAQRACSVPAAGAGSSSRSLLLGLFLQFSAADGAGSSVWYRGTSSSE